MRSEIADRRHKILGNFLMKVVDVYHMSFWGNATTVPVIRINHHSIKTCV